MADGPSSTAGDGEAIADAEASPEEAAQRYAEKGALLAAGPSPSPGSADPAPLGAGEGRRRGRRGGHSSSSSPADPARREQGMSEAVWCRLHPATGSGRRARAGSPTRRGKEGRRLDPLAPGGGSSGVVRQEQWRARRSAPPGRERGERESRCRGLQPATQPGAVPKLRPQRRREPRPRSTPEGEFRPPCRRETRPSSGSPHGRRCGGWGGDSSGGAERGEGEGGSGAWRPRPGEGTERGRYF